MSGPKPLLIELKDVERKKLDATVRRHSIPQQIVIRARIILAAAEGNNNAQISRQLGVSEDMVRLWRRRWVELQQIDREDLSILGRLCDKPRPGAPRRIDDAQVCQIVALACEAPDKSGRPISQWTGREIADEIKERGIVSQISRRHAARLLKRGTFSPIDIGTG